MSLLRAFALTVLVFCSLAGPLQAQAQAPEPRTVIALVEAGRDFRLRDSRAHLMAAMPLEHLGLVVEYHRIDEPLPDISARADVRGILTWFGSTERKGASALLEWLDAAVAAGRKLVVLGELGVSYDSDLGPIPLARINRLVERLGVQFEGSSVAYTAGSTVTIEQDGIWGFERRPKMPPPFPVQTAVDPAATVHMEVTTGGASPVSSAVIVTGPNGGIIAPGYAAEIDPGSQIRRWLVNPFKFFRAAFDTRTLPKPDTTTIVGRRLFYSHVDGDGWRSVSEVKIDDEAVSAARVMVDGVLRRFPDLPVTIAPIAAELDPAWIDDEEARAVARDAFALPHVEVGSHTYSHPFNWSYFQRYDPAAEREIVLRVGVDHEIHEGYSQVGEDQGSGEERSVDLGKYTLPRAFFTEAYDLNREVSGSMKTIAEAAGRPVRVFQWSGDTTPYEAALRATREAGIVNINGGDTRFDSDFRSYGFVAPISVPVGAERQIYASMSNENTYTDLWTDRFFSFRHLLQTIRNTGLPLRVKPVNVYYHSYSAEKIASTNALLHVYEAVREQEIAPVTTSQFASIANGFYAARLIDLGDRRWRVEGRGALQTLRLDDASLTAVNMDRSHGVLGSRPANGSLYVALDPAVPSPEVAFTARADPLTPDPSSRPYLLESRWPASGLGVTDKGVTFETEGYGELEATWIVPAPGRWRVRITQDGDPVWRDTVTVGDDRRLIIEPGDDVEPITETVVRIERADD